jgi:hypothetical protein|tara:strand:+ start:55 stop:192 length:138 start_codon:yes stop_codon:yes gene_type:complete
MLKSQYTIPPILQTNNNNDKKKQVNVKKIKKVKKDIVKIPLAFIR